jgi:non-specific serine/threonine protein kinase/serine/threonine-protein kinase
MDPERWQRVKAVFLETCEGEEAERQARLRAACAGDAELQQQVERLLGAEARAGSLLVRPVEFFPPAGDPAPEPPARIGAYRVLRELGQGGMGTVYLGARDEPGLERRVAIKVVRRGMEAEFVLERFRRERQILSALEHPGIARLYDGGTTEDGLPYFVMEHVEGEELLGWCDARRLPVRERILLFRRVCDAVHYAHQNLVVHRDLKPSNVLVTPQGEPKLLDFGIAKLLSATADEAGVEATATVLRLMTPEYASPEQVRGERVTTASDVYALGVVLYELLSGHRPYRLRGRGSSEIERAVLEEEPPLPSTAATRRETVPATQGREAVTILPAEIGERRGLAPQKLRRALRGDLDNIVMKALDKDAARRYSTAAELSDDLRRYLLGFPVRALPDRRGYRVAKFVRRHAAGVAAATAVALALVGGLGVALWQARIARAERAAAQRHFDDLRRLTESSLFELHDAVRELPGSTRVRELVVRRALEYLQRLSGVGGADPDLQRDLAEAYQRISRVQGGLFGSHLGDTAGAMGSLERALAIRRALVRSFPESVEDRIGLAQAELDLAQLLIAAGEPPRAVDSARRAVATYRDLAGGGVADRSLEAGLARADRYLGSALAASGEGAAALAALRSAVGGFERLAAAEPANDLYRRELAISHQILLHFLPEPEEAAAVASYGAAVAIQEALAGKEPASAELRRQLAYTHFSMGYFRERRGDLAAALAAYGKALTIREELAAADPHNADAQLLLADAYHGVGSLEVGAGAAAAAAGHLARAVALAEAVVRLDPRSVRARVSLARIYLSLGEAAEAGGAGGRTGARGWYTKARATYAGLREEGRLDRGQLGSFEWVERKLAELDGS